MILNSYKKIGVNIRLILRCLFHDRFPLPSHPRNERAQQKENARTDQHG